MKYDLVISFLLVDRAQARERGDYSILVNIREEGIRAERLMRDDDFDFAVSRAYDAMFHEAHAMLLSREYPALEGWKLKEAS